MLLPKVRPAIAADASRWALWMSLPRAGGTLAWFPIES